MRETFGPIQQRGQETRAERSCGGRQTAVGWPRFKEPECRRHRKPGTRADSKMSVPMGLVINSRFPMLRTQLA